MLIADLNKDERKVRMLICGSVLEILADFGFIASKYIDSLVNQSGAPREVAIKLLRTAMMAGIAASEKEQEK